MPDDERACVAVGQTTPTVAADDLRLVAALRRGDEAAFAELLDRHHTALIRLAMVYVADRSVAEEIVQETWLGVFRGIDQFAGRSSLKTWIFRILTNQAKRRGVRERRSIPFSAQSDFGTDTEPSEPAVEPDRFYPAAHQWAGHWAIPPQNWGEAPEARLLARETLAHIDQAIAALPPRQRQVIVLRDVEEWTAGEVCHTLGLSETNQRQLLHRARSRVRRTLASYLEEEG